MEKQKRAEWYYILPVALILLIVPLIVHMKVVPIGATAFKYWKGTNQDYDFFSYYKMVWFLILTVIALITLFIKLYGDKFRIKKTAIYIPMGVYALFVILSTLLSTEKDISVLGFVNRYEGMFVLLGYMAVLFIVINLLDNEKGLKVLLGGLLISSVVIGIIGMFQYFNMDFFQTTLGKKIMLPANYWQFANSLNFQLGPRAVYGTLYHTNYVGSFAAMLFPLSLALFVLAKKSINKILLGLFSALMFLNLITCHSRAGILGSVIAVVILIIALRKQIIPNLKYIIGIVVIFGLIFAGVNSVSKGNLQEKIDTIYNDDQTQVNTTTQGANGAVLRDISVNKDVITITDDNGTMKLAFNGSKVSVTDENNNKIPFNYDAKTSKISFSDPKYSANAFSVLSYNKQVVLQMQRGNIKVNFVVTPTGYKYLTANGQLADIQPVATWGFKGKESLGSARGYIWSRSIPLLKNTVFVGYGPDTFATHFPQYDYMGKLLAYGDASIIVDKPHNIYLQTGINTGIISLIALLAIFILYFISSIKLYFNKQYNSLFDIAGVGIFTAFCGYAIAGLFNDSIISVAPVFWVLLGIGISINLILSGNSIRNRV